LARKGNRQQEVAKLAKVSAATVSRVFAGNGRVSAALSSRVWGAAAELGIDVSRRGRSDLLAFLLCNRKMLHPFHSRVLWGAEDFSVSRDYNMVFLSFRYPSNLSWKELMLPKILERQSGIAGYILAGMNSENMLELLQNQGARFAVLGNNVVGEWKPERYDVVWFDDTGGAHEATRHLQSYGHELIWYVGNSKLPWFARRQSGYCQAMEGSGMEARISTLDSEDPREIGYLGTKSIVAQGRPVTAILAGDDATAHGVYQALRDCCLEVPRDVSVAAIDDVETGLLDPPLTTVRTFPEQVGRQMTELVFNRIRKPTLPSQHRVIPTRMVRRGSTAAPTLHSAVASSTLRAATAKLTVSRSP